MNFKSRIRRLERAFPPVDDSPRVVQIQMGFWFPIPEGTELKPGERVVTDVFQRHTVDRDWQGKGITFELADSRQRITSDPNDNGKTCEPDSRLEDVITEISGTLAKGRADS